MSDTPARRDFLGHLALTGAALAAAACAPQSMAQQAPAPAPAATPPTRADRAAMPLPSAPPTSTEGPWDSAWLDRLSAARYKQVFDVPSYGGGGALFYAKNYLNGIRDWYGAGAPDVQIVMGVHGDAYPILFNDAMWAKFGWGVEKKATDPRTKAPATRNVFWQPREGESTFEFGVDVLQQRGATFALCNNVLRFVARSLAGKTGTTYDAMRQELIAGLLPGVIVVPAMVAAIGLCQAKGCSYVYAGGD